MSDQKKNELATIDKTLLDGLDKMKPAAVNIAASYAEFEEGKGKNYVFVRHQRGGSFVDEATGEEVKAKELVFFMDSGGNTLMSNSHQLVQALKSLSPGTPVHITFLGKVPLQGGKTLNKFSVQPLIG